MNSLMTVVILGIRIRNAFHSSLHPVRRDQWGETEINLIKFVEIETTVLWRSSLFGDLFADYSEPSKHEVTMLRWIHVSYSKRRKGETSSEIPRTILKSFKRS